MIAICLSDAAAKRGQCSGDRQTKECGDRTLSPSSRLVELCLAAGSQQNVISVGKLRTNCCEPGPAFARHRSWKVRCTFHSDFFQYKLNTHTQSTSFCTHSQAIYAGRPVDPLSPRLSYEAGVPSCAACCFVGQCPVV